MSESSLKKCSKCKEEQEQSDFHKDRTKNDGRSATCKSCAKKRSKTYYHANTDKVKKYRQNNKEKIDITRKKYVAENKEKIASVKKDYAERNKEHLAKAKKKWRENNKDRDDLNHKKYRQENRGRVNATNSRRRAAKLQATPKWITQEQLKEIDEIYQDVQDIQWLAEEKLHVDHIYPLQGKTMCGLHVPENLRIVSASENLKKSNKVEGE